MTDKIPVHPNNEAVILAAEDEPDNAFLLRTAFKKTQLPYRLTIVSNGKQAVHYLNGEGEYTERSSNPIPCMLLLDLNMPYMTGFQVLEWLSGQPQFKKLPVVVLSSSVDEEDIRKARDMGAWDYQIKPFNLTDFGRTLQNIVAKWLNQSAPPGMIKLDVAAAEKKLSTSGVPGRIESEAAGQGRAGIVRRALPLPEG